MNMLDAITEGTKKEKVKYIVRQNVGLWMRFMSQPAHLLFYGSSGVESFDYWIVFLLFELLYYYGSS